MTELGAGPDRDDSPEPSAVVPRFFLDGWIVLPAAIGPVTGNTRPGYEEEDTAPLRGVHPPAP